MFSNAVVIVSIAFLAYVRADACVQCNSATDAKCATSPDQYMAKDCTNTTSKCYTRVLNGDTIRGCATDLDNATLSKCNNEMECITCSYIEGCNRQVFPSHRTQCIQCQGNSTGSCALNTYATASVCPIYKLGDKCFIRNNGKNTTTSFERGCLSSLQARKLCLKSENCFTCEGAGCNNLEATSNLIPTARDSAGVFGYSLMLLLACIAAVINF